MRKINIFFKLLLLSCMISVTDSQVTIGSQEASLPGSILQLKNIDGVDDGSANATKGLGLPVVKLSVSDKLYPMFSPGYQSLEDEKHAGLVVYNKAYAGELCPGPYVWDGKQWERLMFEDCHYILIDPQILVFRKTPPKAKSVVVTTAYPVALNELTYNLIEKLGSNITWELFPINGLSQPTFSFLPAINNSGIELSSRVILKGRDIQGNEYTAEVKVVQLKDDLRFIYDVKNPYSYIGGNKTLYVVDSEVDWKMVIKNDPGNIASLTDLATHLASSVSTPYNFSLSTNWDHLNTRKVVFQAIAPNNVVDFGPVDIEVIQQKSPRAVFLNLDNAPGNTYNFGSPTIANSFNLKYTTNANSQYSISGADWNKVFTDVSPAQGSLMASLNDPSQDNTHLVSIMPNINVASIHEGTYSGYLDFATRDHPGATAATQKLTVTRTVPFYAKLAYSSAFQLDGSSVLDCKGATGIVRVNANNDYKIVVTGTVGNVSRSVPNIVSNQPETISWGINTSNNSRQVYVDIQKSDGSNNTRYQFTQKGSFLDGGIYINDNLVARETTNKTCNFVGSVGWRVPTEAEAKSVAAVVNKNVWFGIDQQQGEGEVNLCKNNDGKYYIKRFKYGIHRYISPAGVLVRLGGWDMGRSGIDINPNPLMYDETIIYPVSDGRWFNPRNMPNCDAYQMMVFRSGLNSKANYCVKELTCNP